MDDSSLTSVAAAEEQEAKEPDVTSADPNERKLARRLRIQRRIEEALKRLNKNISEGDIPKDDAQEAKGLLDKQIIASTQLLQRLEREGDELVTNVRVANDSREVDRREAEGISREKIIKHLSDEAEDAEELYQHVNQKWQRILEYHDPLQINESMKDQQRRANELIKQKDNIIEMLKEELKRAEIKFTHDQAVQNDDILILTSRIEKQVTLIRKAYRQELQLIESVIGQERNMLKDTCDKKWEEMYKNRQTMEEDNLNTKIATINNNMECFRNERISFQETFRENKISLETDLQTLQMELQHMKMTTLMNTERMDYNYQILKKREDENIIINSQQKRKINKLQDVINGLKKKIRVYETYSQNEIARISADIQKFRGQISAAEKKSQHFTEVSEKKFMQVWKLNTNRAVEVLNKILNTDRILCEQQLGIPYQPPTHKLLRMEELRSYILAKAKDKNLNFNRHSVSPVCSTNTPANSRKSIRAVTINELNEEKSRHVIEQTQDNDNYGTEMYQKLTRHVLKHIAEKGNFLLEKSLNEVLEPYMTDESLLVRLDNVFFALGINDAASIDLVVQFFLPYAHCMICNAIESHQDTENVSSSHSHSIDNVKDRRPPTVQEESQEIDLAGVSGALVAVHQSEYVIDTVLLGLIDEELLMDLPDIDSKNDLTEETLSIPEKSDKVTVKFLQSKQEKFSCHNYHPLVISSVFVLRALREFVSKVFDDKKSDSKTLGKKRVIVSRSMSKPDIIMYWERFRMIFTDEKERLWEGLLVGLKKYHSILKDRKKIYLETIELKKRNAELRKVLENYEDVRENIRLPPPCPERRFFQYKSKKDTPKNSRIKLPKLNL